MIEEILNNFKQENIDHKPFGHKVINKIFPKNFYNELISNLPNKELYTAINKITL